GLPRARPRRGPGPPGRRRRGGGGGAGPASWSAGSGWAAPPGRAARGDQPPARLPQRVVITLPLCCAGPPGPPACPAPPAPPPAPRRTAGSAPRPASPPLEGPGQPHAAVIEPIIIRVRPARLAADLL